MDLKDKTYQRNETFLRPGGGGGADNPKTRNKT
jgi:hypothetical protein